MITFDTTSQNTKLVWEKVSNTGVAGYKIYRSASLGGIMDSVGYVPETLTAEFVDYSSHALQYAEYYKILPVDSCGNNYGLNDYYYSHAGFLQTFPAGNNTVNLNWNYFGVTQPVNEYETVYYIHRGSSPQNMQIIDTIPTGVIAYTDITAPPGQQYYVIELRRLFPCDPLRVSSGASPYTSSMTNTSVSTVTGIPVIQKDIMLSISPVPASDFLTVKVDKTFLGSKLALVDLNGKIVTSEFITSISKTIDVSGLAAGAYWVSVTGKEKLVKKIIIEK